MTTVTDIQIPAERFAAATAFERLPSLEFQVSGVIGDAPPLVWVTGPTRDDVHSALEADPSIEVLASLTDSNRDRWLFRLEFGESATRFQRLVTETDGAILETTGSEGTWSLKLLFHDRQSLSRAHDQFLEAEFDVAITRMTSLDDGARTEVPLTQTQYETIVKAHELGYFDVPRKVTLKELAAELEISHQALSERLRRSHSALVSSKLTEHRAPPTIE